MTGITDFKGEPDHGQSIDALDSDVLDLIHRVGTRVREAREKIGLPRRVVSEKSGVSPRYLAQLEAGEGNISIGLLMRIAAALDYRIEWLVGEDDPQTSEALRVADMFRSASADRRRKAVEVLSATNPGSLRAHRICLIGLRGAGKSTLGAMAGQMLQMPFMELNIEIEEQAGMPVGEVVALYGPEGYRTLESQALGRIVATHDRLILAAAGGIVSDQATFNTLLDHFHTIWIKASPEEHMSRVRSQGDTRPMAGNPEAMDQLRGLLKSREALYERADAQLDTAGKLLQVSAEELAMLIENEGFLADQSFARLIPQIRTSDP